MSSLTEEQIITIVRKEVRRIIDTGLFYTTEVDKQAQQPQPQKPQANNELAFNPELCNWQQKEGTNGKYEGCKEGPNFNLLKDYLEKHDGKATINGLFYWLFTNKDQIGRKQARREGN